jgi:hypothetical protein
MLPDGFLFLDPANFPKDFAADLPPAQAEFMAYSQMPTAAKVFTTPTTRTCDNYPYSRRGLVLVAAFTKHRQLPGCFSLEADATRPDQLVFPIRHYYCVTDLDQ